jgi:hypothetical protein
MEGRLDEQPTLVPLDPTSSEIAARSRAYAALRPSGFGRAGAGPGA